MENNEREHSVLMQTAIGVGIGLCVGVVSTFFMFSMKSKEVESPSSRQGELKLMKQQKKFDLFDYEEDDDFKMVLVVRSDLKMGTGKIGSQCAHAAVGAYKKMMKIDPEVIDIWKEECGSRKIVLKADSESVMLTKQNLANELGIPTHLVADAGKTQIESGSRTVLALGPAPADLLDKVTGDLKLYR